ncbi:ubiquinone/menaquinone biosynthesis methyltransferase [Mariprofundus micogutta]|uniref:Ubiquinone/menaquinone biosynthesis methyltransferase n=1 Tax=Mariprofundus micogutta TaxID=1921010 RepID=A0A1L8CMJ0_9PROT|nr:rhodoquinone biosynthesis methyltransferase RquA [Mariprofundus micogutta]GAV20128.1 ubiquinone/menaquinone biosynthesis methyltransferase [Mariprofundus micogutta]
MFKLYRHFMDGKPLYLVRYYWWAYLWPRSVWFFDHQPIINAILFGQYNRLMSATLECMKKAPLQRVLQLTCVYGSLTPNLIRQVLPAPLHITDVAEVQLELAASKVEAGQKLCATRMNAEQLAYREDSFSTIVLFFLLHEMPHEARCNTLSEVMRTLQVGGSLILTEYGTLPSRHWLYRFPLTRWITTSLEPFLYSFWHEDIEALFNELGRPFNKSVEIVSHQSIFASFYRVTEFRVRNLSMDEQGIETQ